MGRKIVVHGGWDGRRRCFDDLWVFDTDCFAWLQPQTAGLAPTARYGHSLCLLEDGRIALFGGISLDQDGTPIYGNDVHTLDTETMTWTAPRLSWNAGLLSGRSGHSFTLGDEGYALIYGGWGMGGVQDAKNKKKGSATLTILDTSTDSEVQVQMRGKGLLPGRHGHSCCSIGNAFFIVGGWDAQQAVNDVLVLEILESGQQRRDAQV